MPALTPAERSFLAYDWRWAEVVDETVKDRHPGAREAEYQSAFVTIAGAARALQLMSVVSTAVGLLVIGTVDGVLDISFRGRPPTVGLRTRRFGGDPFLGRLMIVERATRDHQQGVTVLYLKG